jgi:aldehyde:ferredoxin oxidoreductase
VNAVCDSSGFCQFLQPNLDDIRNFYGALYGTEVSRETIHDIGWQCLADEWKFNERAGMTDADDRLAECMATDPIGAVPTVFDVSADIIRATKQRMPPRPDLFSVKATG